MCRFIHSNCIPIGDQQLSQSLTVRVVVAFEADIQVIDDVDRVAIAVTQSLISDRPSKNEVVTVCEPGR